MVLGMSTLVPVSCTTNRSHSTAGKATAPDEKAKAKAMTRWRCGLMLVYSLSLNFGGRCWFRMLHTKTLNAVHKSSTPSIRDIREVSSSPFCDDRAGASAGSGAHKQFRKRNIPVIISAQVDPENVAIPCVLTRSKNKTGKSSRCDSLSPRLSPGQPWDWILIN